MEDKDLKQKKTEERMRKEDYDKHFFFSFKAIVTKR